MVTKEQIIEVLKKIEDPELFIDIWTLGLIYDVAVVENSVKIKMTFTSMACPAGPEIVGEIKSRTRKEIPELEVVDVEVVFDPPWQPSDELKGMMGIF